MSRLGRYFTIRACVRDLSQRLAREYGLRDEYSIAEIDKVMAAWDMHLREPAYAYALFCTRREFERLGLDLGRASYDEYRGDVLRQYPRLERLNGQALAVFVRSYWRSGLRFFGGTERGPLMGPPDAFPEAAKRARVSEPIYEEPTLGMRGVLVWLAAAVSLFVLAGLLVARLVSK